MGGDGTGDSAVDAEYVLVDDGCEGHAVECVVDGVPYSVADVFAESFFALSEEGS